ncbi:nuclear transport factor 2 family protein [Sphingomonas ginkgonis]|uniref:Nuclear transport factor 2 family protein n=1 Tax=Sphingomonas ginkgonis TaxID=2315330 RepID=A0A429VBH0_9SPHN|nr:nuclear transport factor 2 family protein [Sphingomonas ginkgonis]RST31318.1 nuclear transport factor 2 family protein [Sphingomonas ginkgonis]
MSDIHEQIEAVAIEWMQAWVRSDAATLEKFLAPDFALIVSATPNHRLERTNWLNTACTRYRASEFRYRDVQVRDLGDGIAAMSSIAEFKAEIDGDPRTGPLFLVDVWRRMEGCWRVCTRYSSAPEDVRTGSAAVTTLR